MLPERLADELRAGLADVGIRWHAEIRVERPLRPEHGDYSSPVALQVGRAWGRPARELAESLAARLRETNGVHRVAVDGAGHLNVWLTPAGLAELAGELAANRTEADNLTDETVAHLAMLLRGAAALGVDPADPDLDDLAGTRQRQLICLLAETTDLLRRRPDRMARQAERIRYAWEQVEAVQPILPKGDSTPDARHAAGRLLAEATNNVLVAVLATRCSS